MNQKDFEQKLFQKYGENFKKIDGGRTNYDNFNYYVRDENNIVGINCVGRGENFNFIDVRGKEYPSEYLRGGLMYLISKKIAERNGVEVREWEHIQKSCFRYSRANIQDDVIFAVESVISAQKEFENSVEKITSGIEEFLEKL